MSHYSLVTKEGYRDMVFPERLLPNIYFNGPADFSLDEINSFRINEVRSKMRPGFDIGVLYGIQLRRNLYLDISSCLSSHGFETVYETVLYDQNENQLGKFSFEGGNSLIFKISTPILLNYYFLNDSFSLLGGLTPLLLLRTPPKVSISGVESYYHGLLVKMFGLSADIGVGYNYWFKVTKTKADVRFGVQLKYSFGLFNLIKGNEVLYPDVFYYLPLESVRCNRFLITFLLSN